MEEPGNEASCFGYNYGDIEIWRMTGRATYCVRVQKTHITESVDSVCRDTTYAQYMPIQKNLSKSQKRYTYKPL